MRPPWCDAPARRTTLLDIVIDPNQAFGTGAHATTRLCLEALLALPEPGGPLVDLGCGSGVLAIAAAKLGWDPVARPRPRAGGGHRRARERAGQRRDARRAPRRPAARRRAGAPSAPTVVANLLRPLLAHVARTGFAGEPPRVLIVSGLLRAEADAIAAAFAREQGLREQARGELGEWAALTLVRGLTRAVKLGCTSHERGRADHQPRSDRHGADEGDDAPGPVLHRGDPRGRRALPRPRCGHHPRARPRRRRPAVAPGRALRADRGGHPRDRSGARGLRDVQRPVRGRPRGAGRGPVARGRCEAGHGVAHAGLEQLRPAGVGERARDDPRPGRAHARAGDQARARGVRARDGGVRSPPGRDAG